MRTNLTLNGDAVSVETDGPKPLLWVLRDDLKLTGTKYGCGVAACGACTVHVGGAPVRSCVTFINTLEGAEVTTIEGLNTDAGRAAQQAWAELNVVQCGYCQSGQIMSAAALLASNSNPRVEQIDAFMAGNVCRCATYQRVRAAVLRASELLRRMA